MLPDTEVARRIGTTKLSVFNRRKKLGILAALKRVQSIVSPDILGGRRIAEMTADEFLAAIRLAKQESSVGRPRQSA
jgi:DNA-binding Lrp family transcriptional regulator